MGAWEQAKALSEEDIVPLRPTDGSIIERGERSIDASALASIAGEAVLNERALKGRTKLAGRKPEAALLVENLGPYLDLQAPENWMDIHVPGWNTATVKHLLEQMNTVPLLHFGDLDPGGVEIVSHLRQGHPRLRWAVPEFWREYVHERTLRKRWPDNLVLQGAPPLVHELKESGLWLEQESIMLDPRLTGALRRCLLA